MRSGNNLLIRGTVIGGTLLVILAGAAQAQTVSYTLGAPGELLDAAFYAGEASDGSNVAGRGVLNVGVNSAGTKALFWAINLSTFQMGLFSVNIGNPSSWQRRLPDEGFAYTAVVWMPDDRHVRIKNGVLYDSVTNNVDTGWLIDGWLPRVTSTTARDSDNWAVGSMLGVAGANIPAYAILPNGNGDPTRENIEITAITLGGTNTFAGCVLSNDADSLVFQVTDLSAPGPDTSDVYRLSGVNAILSAPKIPSTETSSLAPTSLGDPRIVEIRASTTTNFIANPNFSGDGSLVFTTEDYGGIFDSADFFTTLNTDWDINISNSDGTGYLRFAEPGGQGAVIPFRNGDRFHYINNYHILVSTLSVESDIDAETNPIPGAGTNSTTVNGNPVTVPFVLTDSAIATSTPVDVGDASGTVVFLPADQVINFPSGSGATSISIVTPIDPVAPIELPDPQTSIPVRRDFGPDGTQFYPPITVSISYTDAEVASVADEANMIPYLYNAGLGMFEPLDSAFLPTVTVDTINNILSFQTDHFSTYGIGGPKGLLGAPQHSWSLIVLSMTIGLLGVAAFVGMYRAARGGQRG